MRLLRPEALWLFALAVPLVLVHLRMRRRVRVTVPSLLAWDPSALGGAPPRAAGIRPRELLGLLLELAALSCLVLFAAGPVERDAPPEERPLAIVLDGSASTGAAGRFEEMRGLALRAMEAAGPAAPVSLWLAAGEVEVLCAPGESRARAKEALAAARPRSAGGGALLAAAEAALGNGSEVVVLTDGCDADAAGLAGRADLRLVSVGKPERNLAVVGVAAERRRPAEGSLFLRIRGEDGKVREEDRSAEFAAALAAGGRAEASFGVRGPGDPPVDALPADDFVTLSVLPLPPLRLAVVTSTGTLDPWLAAALEACGDAVDAGLSVAVRPEGLGNLAFTPDVILGGADPGGTGAPRLQFGAGIGPVREAPTLQVGDRLHPVLRGVDPAEWIVTRGRALEALAGDAVLLQGPEGPLAVAGLRQGARAVILGFEPGESTLPLSGSWPVFLRNALLWLAGDGGPAAVSVGEGALLDEKESDLVPRVPRNADGFAPPRRPARGEGPRSRAADFGLAAAILLVMEWLLFLRGRGGDVRSQARGEG